MDGKIFEMASRLNYIGVFFESMMKASIKNYEDRMSYSTIMISKAVPSHEDNTVRRLLNRERCIALINMDHDQIALAEQCASERQRVRKEAADFIAKGLKQAKVEKSAWFSGEYDERTYY